MSKITDYVQLHVHYTVQLFQNKLFLVFLIQILPLLAQFMFGCVGLTLVLKPDYKFILKDQIISLVLSFSILYSDICAKQRVSLNPQTYYYLLSAPWRLDCCKLR